MLKLSSRGKIREKPSTNGIATSLVGITSSMQRDCVPNQGSQSLLFHRNVERLNSLGYLDAAWLLLTVTDVLYFYFREKKKRRNHFDLGRVVHEAEYKNVKKPIDTRTKSILEPAHKFEVNLEPDSFTAEKSVWVKALLHPKLTTLKGSPYSKITREKCTMSTQTRFPRGVFSVFCAQV